MLLKYYMIVVYNITLRRDYMTKLNINKAVIKHLLSKIKLFVNKNGRAI